MDINEKQYFFVDLDRTFWEWSRLKIGAKEFFNTLERTEKQLNFYTDNTLLSRKGYQDRLKKFKTPIELENILTSGYVTGKHLEEENINRVHVLGESDLHNEISQHGIEISRKADNAVLGLDQKFNYDKLTKLKEISEQKDNIYTCSKEKTFKKGDKEIIHQKPLNKAIQEFTNPIDTGKSSKIYINRFKKYFDYNPGKSVLIGDSREDVILGNSLGMTTVLALGGNTSKEDIPDLNGAAKPNYALNSLYKLKRKII